jgi:hypothetical protein
MAVDTLGHLLALHVTAADERGPRAAATVCSMLLITCNSLLHFWLR